MRIHAAVTAVLAFFTALALPASAEVTAYEGARLIVGDGKVIER